MNLLLTGGNSMIILIAYVVIFGVFMYFVMIRPQKKEQKRMQDMLGSLEVGDSVVTTSGFYGIVIAMGDDEVIVEFGNNKNCRIPMRKEAIAQVEKPEQAVKAVEKKAEEKTEKAEENKKA